MTTMRPPTAHITRNKPKMTSTGHLRRLERILPSSTKAKRTQVDVLFLPSPSAALIRPRCGTNSQDMPNPTLSRPPHIRTGGSHWPGPPLHGPYADFRAWSASPDGLPTPPGPGCEPVPISEARHVPDTAPIGPRLARVFKIYIIERLISVYHAER